MSGEIPFIPDERDTPVPAQDPEIPVHLVFELAEEAVEETEDQARADAVARVEEQTAEQTVQVFIPKERTEAERQRDRQIIYMAGEALARERRKHHTYSLAVPVPSKRREY